MRKRATKRVSVRALVGNPGQEQIFPWGKVYAREIPPHAPKEKSALWRIFHMEIFFGKSYATSVSFRAILPIFARGIFALISIASAPSFIATDATPPCITPEEIMNEATGLKIFV